MGNTSTKMGSQGSSEYETAHQGATPEFAVDKSRASAEQTRKWLAYDIPWDGTLKKRVVPGIGDALINILEEEEEWNSLWKLFGQFLLCMHIGESTLEGCDRFKQKLALLCKKHENGPSSFHRL